MAARRRITVLVVAEHRDTRALYVDTLLAEGYMVHGVALQDQAESVARATRFDIAVLDSPLDAGGSGGCRTPRGTPASSTVARRHQPRARWCAARVALQRVRRQALSPERARLSHSFGTDPASDPGPAHRRARSRWHRRCPAAPGRCASERRDSPGLPTRRAPRRTPPRLAGPQRARTAAAGRPARARRELPVANGRLGLHPGN